MTDHHVKELLRIALREKKRERKRARLGWAIFTRPEPRVWTRN